MNRDYITRRRLLAAGAVAGSGVATYAVDNPVHRSASVSRVERRGETRPSPGSSWAARSTRPAATDADVTQLLGVRYIGADEGRHYFDLVTVAAGRRTGLLGSGPLLSNHRLGLRGVGDSATFGADEGSTDLLTAGVVLPPEGLVSRTGLSLEELDDPAAFADQVGREGAFGTESELASVRALLDDVDPGDGFGSERFTLAGILYALGSETTEPAVPTPKFQGRGERYRVPLDGVVAHAVYYGGLILTPGDERAALKVASLVPRPSLLGTPSFRSELVVSFPA